MEDRNINEKFRKPRRTKGTPFFVQRNYIAAGILALSGLSWYLYELWPQAQKLKKRELEGKLDLVPSIQEHFLEAQLATTQPGYSQLITGLKAREA